MGLVASIASQMFPPKSKFSVDDIPDLSGKVMIVTGGNTGIGKETIKALLSHNAKVYMASRSQEKAQAAIDDLKQQTGKEAIFLKLDLASFESIREAVKEFLSKEQRLDVLFNNGGVMWPNLDQFTVEGYDLQLGTNVIGHHLFTKLLLPILTESAKSSPENKSRVVFTSSSGMYVGKLDWDTFREGKRRLQVGTFDLYYNSKFLNVVQAREVARRYGDQGIVCTSLNPGNLKTDLQRHLESGFKKTLLNAMLYPAPYGALTQLWAGTSPETLDFNGKFLIPWARVGRAKDSALDPKTGEKFWEWLEEETKSAQEGF